MPLSKITKDRLHELLDVMEKHVSKIDMSNWLDYPGGTYQFSKDNFFDPECDTTGCIAGFSVVHFTLEEDLRSILFSQFIIDHAKDVLQITGRQADLLFYVYNWPKKHQYLYDKAQIEENPKEAFAILKRRVLYFIQTGGAR